MGTFQFKVLIKKFFYFKLRFITKFITIWAKKLYTIIVMRIM